jgi:hypothetical protein
MTATTPEPDPTPAPPPPEPDKRTEERRGPTKVTIGRDGSVTIESNEQA